MVEAERWVSAARSSFERSAAELLLPVEDSAVRDGEELLEDALVLPADWPVGSGWVEAVELLLELDEEEVCVWCGSGSGSGSSSVDGVGSGSFWDGPST